MPNIAVIVAVTAAATDFVDTTNVADELPAAIWTVAETPALALFDLRFTVNPPVGAFPLRLIDPAADVPPATVEGVRLRLDSEAGVIVKEVVTVVVPKTADRVDEIVVA